jgi:NADH:ubiquinone oxidoreductase subunit D
MNKPQIKTETKELGPWFDEAKSGKWEMDEFIDIAESAISECERLQKQNEIMREGLEKIGSYEREAPCDGECQGWARQALQAVKDSE